MSYSYERSTTQTKRRTAGGYGHSGNRSTFGYWLPLTLTVAAATVGVVAWIWSERKDDEEDSGSEEHTSVKPGYGRPQMSGGLPPDGYQGQGPPPPGGNFPPGPGPAGFQAGFQQSEMGPPMQGGFQGPPPGGPPMQGGFQRDITESTTRTESAEQTTLISTLTGGTMKRAPSPGQSYDWATTKLAAGVGAIGALVGGALGTVKEGSPDDYEDHERWSEEAGTKQPTNTSATNTSATNTADDVQIGIKRRGTNQEFYSGEVQLPRSVSLPSTRRRKNVAVVVSAVELNQDGETDLGSHASILSHLPSEVDLSTTRLFVLIYAPDLKTHPLSPAATRRQSQSMTSSFSNISQTDAHTPAVTPGEFPGDAGILANIDPNPIDETSTLYKTLHNQAAALVERDTMIIPFTSPTGHKHILKSLTPEVVYIQESLCGRDGDLVADLSGWVKQTVVVIGDEGGHGGLVDTDDEGGHAENRKQGDLWWMKEERTGLGKRVTVVESEKIVDDWRRRVGEAD